MIYFILSIIAVEEVPPLPLVAAHHWLLGL